VEPSVGSSLRVGRRDGSLEQTDALARAVERPQRLGDRIEGELECNVVLGVALTLLERALERMQRSLVVAGVVLPTA
jgi:hypothetical protein